MGKSKICSALSASPPPVDAPPVSTIPELRDRSYPARLMSSHTRWKISAARGCRISERMRRDISRDFLPPTLATSIVSRSSTIDDSAQPLLRFSFSASGTGVRSPTAMSLVKWSPPSATTPVCHRLPRSKIAMSAVPPPISTSATPSSFSSMVSTASAAASCSITMSTTLTPARLTHDTMFCVDEAAPVTTWTLTSSRAPAMPIGAPMPSWSSTTKSCGRTWRISRPVGNDTALAASMARLTSSRVISRFLPATAITPRLLKPLMCGPDSDRCTVSISTPAISSASSIAFLIDSTAASRFTTTPRLMPRDSATPMPTTSRRPSSSTSLTTQHTVEVPTSRPTRYRSLRATLLSSGPGPARRRAALGQGVAGAARAGAHVDVLAEPQVHIVDVVHPVAQRLGDVDVGLQPFGEQLVAQPHHRRVAVEDHGGVARVGDVDLRDPPDQMGAALERAQQPAGQPGADRIHQRRAAAIAGGQAVDDGQIQLGVAGPELVDDRPGPIDQEQLIADPADANRLAFLHHHANRRREDPPDAGVGDPRRAAETLPPPFEVHRQDVHAFHPLEHGDDLAARHARVAVNADVPDGQHAGGEDRHRPLIDRGNDRNHRKDVAGHRHPGRAAGSSGRRHVRAAEALVRRDRYAHAASSSARNRRLATVPIDPAPSVSTASPGLACAASIGTSSSSVFTTETGRSARRRIASASASAVTPGIGSSLAA